MDRELTAELVSYLFSDYTAGIALFYFNGESPSQADNFNFHLLILCLTATLKLSMRLIIGVFISRSYSSR